jgi:hypothetical protein
MKRRQKKARDKELNGQEQDKTLKREEKNDGKYG